MRIAYPLLIAGTITTSSAILATAVAAHANDLDVPVLEQGGDGQAANCWSAMVSGLKADGDGFLAVRSGPGSQYPKIDELHNGEIVIVFQNRCKWAGVVYRTPNATCHSTKTHPVPYEKKGWIRTDWLKDVAG
jgi:hypothetical protein